LFNIFLINTRGGKNMNIGEEMEEILLSVIPDEQTQDW